MQESSNPGTNLAKVKAVIFDVDGTLYDQSKLRKKMLYALLSFYARHPWRLKEMLMLSHFRAERERRAGQGCPDLENTQYIWCAEKKGYPIQLLKEVIAQWIFSRPLQYLPGCLYPGTKDLFNTLRQQGIKVAIYSDYKAHEKLEAMGLEADLIISSTDPEVNQLKPHPKGLLYVIDKLGLDPADCLFIGDRQEMDGECALRAGVPYMIIDKKPFHQFDFYKTLTQQLNNKNKQYETQRLA